ncbi:MAG: quinolinate synthase NadA [Bryobacteraceae bacterium]|nr:quinolinate synthase NadA [Bryobacteraceae bacterium]
MKAESDILCTSRNAVQIVNSIPREKPILFVPDANLGHWVKRQTGRENMKVWQGACIVHATFPARRLAAARAEHPGALVAAHPECPAEVLDQADFVGSTSAIIKWCVETPGEEFIVMTESGVAHSLRRLAPHKRFFFIPNENCNCSECPYMKRNTLEKLRDCLRDLEPRVEIPEDILHRALVPLERMFAVRSFLDAGIFVTQNSDYPPGPFEPMMAIQSSVTRTDMNGNVWGASQRITVDEALRVGTLHGAYASFEEDLKGSIEAGKLADLVVLGRDPHEVPPGEIIRIPIERTMVGGRWVFEA